MSRVVPVPVPVDQKTFLPQIRDIEARITEKSKAVVPVNPDNPSGVVLPKSLLKEISTLCKNRGIWLILDEAYREFLFNSESCFLSPVLDDHVIKLYTMSKVYGMAGWRVGAILYPKRIHTEMNKVQDTIPTHASVTSQIAAYETLKENPLYKKDNYVNELRFVRSCFLEHLKNVYSTIRNESFAVPNGAFYFFLPYDEMKYIPSKTEIEDRDAVDFLATNYRILVLPGFSFGMCGYMRVSYDRVSGKQKKKVSIHFGEALRALLQYQKTRRAKSGARLASKDPRETNSEGKRQLNFMT